MVIHPDLHHVNLLPGQLLDLALDFFDGVHLARDPGISRQDGRVTVLSGKAAPGSENRRAHRLLRPCGSANLRHRLKVGSQTHYRCDTVAGVLLQLGHDVVPGVVLTRGFEALRHPDVPVCIDQPRNDGLSLCGNGCRILGRPHRSAGPQGLNTGASDHQNGVPDRRPPRAIPDLGAVNNNSRRICGTERRTVPFALRW